MKARIDCDGIKSIYPMSIGLRPGWRIELRCGQAIRAEFIIGPDMEDLWAVDCSECSKGCDDCPIKELRAEYEEEEEGGE